MRKKIHYAKPSITDLEIKYVEDAIRTGWGPKCYDYIKKFEAKFSEYLDVKYSLATSSCTGAITLAFAAINLQPGDEVIIADINWIASVAPIMYFGATPVFVDVRSDSWCIDHEKIEAAITPKTKAILVVHLYGNMAEIETIMEIAEKHNLYVIEDSAEALGSEFRGKKAGTFGHFSTFSFHGTKTVTTGEGGMLSTNNEELYAKVKILNDHGRSPKERKAFFPVMIGYKFKMSNLQAALGLAQMERVEELVQNKRDIFYKYKKNFEDIPEITMNPEPNYTINSYWMPTVVFDKSLKIDRDKFIQFFRDLNVDMRVFFYPLSLLQMFENVESNVVSYDIYYRALNLPSYFELEDEQINFVTDNILEYIGKKQ